MIIIRRGTTDEVVVELTDEKGNIYKLSDGDTLIFGVKRNVTHKHYELSKTITKYDGDKGGYVVSFVPEDTKGLDFGNYVYDIGLQKATGEFYIVCECDEFVVADTVTEKV